MKTKRLWLATIASLFLLVTFMSSCKDENVEVIGVCPLVISTNPANLAVNVPLNQIITATFNEAMNPQTFTQASFVVEAGAAKMLKSEKSVNAPVNAAATPVVGTVTFSGVVATFTPSSPLADNTTYSCRIVASVKDVMGNALQVDYVWTFSTGTLIAPTVILVDPLNAATSVALDKVLSANFSVAMDPLTITTSTFTLMDGVTPIVGTVGYTGTTATFTPSSNLELGKTYTATIKTGAQNVAGTALINDYVWTFSTGAVLAPTVISVDPLNAAINVPLNKVISANFSVAMDPLTINSSTFTLFDGLTAINGTVNYSGTTATFTPTNNLELGKTYTATVTIGAHNVAGTAIAHNYVWSFSTGALVAPTVVSVDPLNAAINVPLNKVLSANFSVAMNPATITTSTFTLFDGPTPIVGTVGYTGTTATFTPTNNLELGKTYTATITTGAQNVAGTAIAQNYVWSFSTGALLAPTVVSVDPLNAAINVAQNKVLRASFSVAMDPLTITTSTFKLYDGLTPITGTVGYSGTTATFTPNSNLALGETYTATITTGAQNTAGTALVNNYVWSFSTGALLAPTVVSVDPLNAATNVALNKVLSANFSVAMNPATITTSTFTLLDGVTPVVGTVGYTGTTATFTPTSNLELGKTYTATITTGAQNTAGTALVNNYVWSFSTGAVVVPTVISTIPVNLAIDVLFGQLVTANFSVAMNPATISSSTFTLFDGVTPIAGTVSYSGTTATFNPTSNLPAGKTFTATITTGAQNTAGTALLNDYIWSFTTQYSLTVTAVNGTVVKNPNQTGYNSGANVQLTANPSSGYSFSSWSGDASGNNNPLLVVMNANKNITANFTLNPPLGPGAIDLGTAGDFAILTKSGISTTGTTLITGHIGVSPIDQTAITGFSETMDASGTFSTSIYVVGRIYASDYLDPTPAYVSTAVSDQETAFTTAMGLTTSVIVDLGAGDISGMTLAPALYKWNTGLLITNQGVTLEGGPNDTWVFQIADDFTIQNDAIITLAGGAQAKNIFWITSTQALLGSNVNFSGNILAQTLISLTNGTTVLGRLLSQTAVTLNASTVTKP